MSFFAADPLTFIYISIAITAIVTLLSFIFGDRLSHSGKILFFSLLAVPIILSSIYLGAHTIHKNIVSETKGPVHWHIDYQVHVCGERLDLIDPTGLSNKIGSPLFHEHDDDRVHVEGTVMRVQDVDLGAYFEVIGGRLTETSLVYPTNEGIVSVQEGQDTCDGQPANLKIYINGRQIENPTEHVPYPDAYVPPGDCVIVDFSPGDSPTTDKICESWESEDWTYENYEQLRAEGEN